MKQIELNVELTLDSLGLSGEEFSTNQELENAVNKILSNCEGRFNDFSTCCMYSLPKETLRIDTTLDSMPTADEIKGLCKMLKENMEEVVKCSFSVLSIQNHDLEGFTNLYDAIDFLVEDEEAYAVSYRGEHLFIIDDVTRNVFSHTTAMMYYSHKFNEDECIRLFGERLGNQIWNKFDGDFLKLLGELDDKCRTTINYAIIACMNKTNRWWV